jgi:hypothetical protein
MMVSGSAVQTKGLGLSLVSAKETFDSGLEIDERAEHTALQPSPGQQLGEEALDSIEPRGRFRRVVEHGAGMAIEPGAHFEVLVTTVIVEDDVDDFAVPGLGLDCVEEADETPDVGAAACSLLSSTSRAANSVVVP